MLARKSSNSILASELRAIGARATPARIRVMEILNGAPHALSHGQIEEKLREFMHDRVTLYRVLDWLVGQGLAHRTTDAKRVFRYSSAKGAADHDRHAHFRCGQCGRVFCLQKIRSHAPKVPRGYRVDRVEVSVQGACANCARTTKTAKR